MSYLPEGLPTPSAGADGLSTPYWEGTRREKLFIQFCRGCNHWQWGPEWICHRCNSFDLDWREVQGRGVIYSYQRIWHPVHPALNGHGPYIAVLVELPAAGSVRMVGNLLGDPKQDVPIGGAVEAVFEHHNAAASPFTLVHWRLI
jgi:hypothetical protein